MERNLINEMSDAAPELGEADQGDEMELKQVETVGDLMDELWRIDQALREKHKEHARFVIDGRPALDGMYLFEAEKTQLITALRLQKSVRPLHDLCTANDWKFTWKTINQLRSLVRLEKGTTDSEIDSLSIDDFVAHARSLDEKSAPLTIEAERTKKPEYDPGPDAGPYSPKQAAHRLGISPSKVYDLCRNQVLRHERIGRRIIIRREHLEEYQAEFLRRDPSRTPTSGFRHL